MSIYKASNLQPHLQEVDVEQNNTFSCQVNTSGTPVYAYKMDILSIDGEKEIYKGNAVELATPIENKEFLDIPNINKQATGMHDLDNGKDYQWKVRTYEAPISSTQQPQTLVCSRFLTGSTKYVIWTNNSDQILMNRWVEFSTIGTNQLMPPPIPNSDNMVLPQEGETFIERKQISWVEKELGWDKNFTKIELEGEFTYNYINGTEFKIFQCSDKHTVNSIFVDPNDEIKLGCFIEIYRARTLIESRRKIVGYSNDTGEIRVQQPFSAIPQNGDTYKIYEYDLVNKEYKEIVFEDVSNKIGGEGIVDSTNFKVITNCWDNNLKQLFIQPNINIKTDETNPNEIVFDNDGVRLDIVKRESSSVIPRKITDITFNKLDNTQWLLSYFNDTDSAKNVVITPKTYYKVYSDFMDSSPNGVFYARKTPEVIMKLRDSSTNTITEYTPINQNKRVKIQPNSFIEKTSEGFLDNYYLEAYNRRGDKLNLVGSEETKNLIVDYNLNLGMVYLQDDFEFTESFPSLDTTCSFKLYKNNDEINFTGINNTFLSCELNDNIYTVVLSKNILINQYDIIKIYLEGLLISKEVKILSVDQSSDDETIITFSADDIKHDNVVAKGDTYLLFDSTGKSEKYFNQLSNYFELFYGWRDVEFKRDWVSENNTLIKYYQYSLYDSDNMLIGQSEEKYDTQLLWEFKGFDSGSNNGALPPTPPIIFPSKYTVELKIVDIYDKVFIQKQNFSIYYKVERGYIPLQIEEVCQEHAVKVVPTVPAKVVSTHLLDEDEKIDLYTATSINISDNALAIPEGYCLNYTQVAGSESGIELPQDFSCYFEFKLGTDKNSFLKNNLTSAKETTIAKFVHNVVKINQYNEEEIVPEELEIRIGSANKFYWDDTTNKYTINPNYMKIRVYNLDAADPTTPLPCFSNGDNYFSIIENDELQEFADITDVSFALQKAIENDDKYQIVEQLPYENAEKGKYYIPISESGDNGIIYRAEHIYLYDGAYYILQVNRDYVYLENLNQMDDATYDNLEVPEILRGENGEILWSVQSSDEEKNKWIDAKYITQTNIDLLSKKWFKLYLTGKTQNNIEDIHCTIKISNERG